MIAPMMGAPAFVCCLIPVYSLKYDLILEKTQKRITLIHQNGDYTFLLMADSLRVNQARFTLYKEIFRSTDIFFCKHPVENEELENLYLLCDPTHLLKNNHKNWLTEKMQKLKFTNPATKKEVTTNQSDLIAIYKIGNDSLSKLTKLNHATLYSTNFKKQKVTLVLNIFTEKTADFSTLPVPCISESCIEIEIKLNFYFHTSL